jgi:mannose-6-phosphate isomerase
VNGPSKVASTDQLLSAWIKESANDPLGLAMRTKWPDLAGHLPFLFKVLSIAKALSIQAHPDKELAKKLFAENPQMYKDPNHKPEMTLALTQFEALCSFKPVAEIAATLTSFPELRQAVGLDTADKVYSFKDVA